MNARRIQTRSSSLDRIGLVVVTLVGMAMCTAGIGKVAETGQWLSFAGMTGSLLGVVILAIVGARLVNRALPLIATDRAAIVAVIALAAVKVAIAAVFSATA